ncbi:sensor histidine kinase/response regulator [Aspergillus homomorphus CBS 101889]|uniref:Sensor histidine kinase/response regulator n=1 Tax=Aspergillus homomorphus (strain CBS 101889) TaxID=1450537 RepID=A0A395I4H8_ASPHC|nr:sensor histidine kinase/response regulator [Aspergillus homomorphus CBS 101889]RAL14088.1 sensor histidine kinase/response regulator [Aspergillus homomorphus CBS 101889]
MAPDQTKVFSFQALDRTDGLPQPLSALSSGDERNSSSEPCPTPDSTLSALCQLGVYQLSCKCAFVGSFENGETQIIAEAGSANLTDNKASVLGMMTLGLRLGEGGTIGSPGIAEDACNNIIRDIAAQIDVNSHPFIKQHPHARFYVEVPLRSSSGEILGTYGAVDDQARPSFGEVELTALHDLSKSVTNHLETVRAARRHIQADRLLTGLTAFSKGQSSAQNADWSNRRKSIASSRVSPRSLDVPDVGRLSVSSTSTREVSPSSSRQRETPQESSFFQHRASGNTQPTSPWEQQGSRKRSDDPNKLVIVPESAACEKTLQLFARASTLLQECMGLDGVIFVDASRTNSRSGSTASVGDWDILSRDSDLGVSSRSPSLSSHGQWAERSCEALGLATSIRATESNQSSLRPALTEGLFHDLFNACPYGEIFNSPQSVGLSPPNSFRCRRNSQSRKESEVTLRQSVESRLTQTFPEARSFIFLPLWNWNRSRWLAGTLIWTCDDQRLFDQDDLHFLKTFGDSVVSKYCQLEWTATEKSKSDLLSSVSHELRSPLHGMLTSTELLQSTGLESAQQDMVTMIETCGLTLLDTMNHLLDFTKINNLTLAHKRTGGTASVLDRLMTDFELDTLIEDVADSLYVGHRSLINASKIAGRYLQTGTAMSSGATKTSNPDDLSVIVQIEDLGSWNIQSLSGGWRRIVMNILGNAFKFTRSGYIEISLAKKVQRDVGSKQVFAHFSVTDTGCGISPDFLEHQLFKPFAQKNILTEGVGLGLSVVNQVVTYLGGEVDVKSTIGVGTQVDVYVPLDFVAEKFAPPEPIPSSITRVSLVGLNAYADLRQAPGGLLRPEAKRKLALRSALSNVLLSQPGWMLSFADSIDKSSGDIGVIEESALKALHEKGGTRLKFNTVVVIGEQGVSLPTDLTIEGSDVIYIPQPIGPRKIIQALRRIHESRQNTPFMEQDYVVGPFPGAQRGRSLSDAFALAKGSESPPVVRENVSEFAPDMTRASRQNDLHVLIVDDNDINIKILTTFMRKIGCSYETATDGLIALEKFKASPKRFDYILMDISMPVMDGIESSSKIREYEEETARPRTAIMAVTGVASSEMQQQAFAAGIDDYLVKPLSLHDLKRIMNIA